MAGTKPNSGAKFFHGVAHLFTASDMEKLDALEFGYDRVPVQMTQYDG